MQTDYSRENPSARFRMLGNLYREVHTSGLPADGIAGANLFAGKNLLDHVARVRLLATASGARSILDYGSGKGLLYKLRDIELPDGSMARSIANYWGVTDIRCFDPGVPEYAQYPETQSDGVVCTDVLEHVPEEDIPWMLAELFQLARRFVYANIASYPAGKTLPNGWNAHVTIRPPDWWAARIAEAARGWTGSAYEFRVRERKSQLIRLARRICGLDKWTVTTIAEHLNVPPVAPGGPDRDERR